MPQPPQPSKQSNFVRLREGPLNTRGLVATFGGGWSNGQFRHVLLDQYRIDRGCLPSHLEQQPYPLSPVGGDDCLVTFKGSTSISNYLLGDLQPVLRMSSIL